MQVILPVFNDIRSYVPTWIIVDPGLTSLGSSKLLIKSVYRKYDNMTSYWGAKMRYIYLLVQFSSPFCKYLAWSYINLWSMLNLLHTTRSIRHYQTYSKKVTIEALNNTKTSLNAHESKKCMPFQIASCWAAVQNNGILYGIWNITNICMWRHKKKICTSGLVMKRKFCYVKLKIVFYK